MAAIFRYLSGYEPLESYIHVILQVARVLTKLTEPSPSHITHDSLTAHMNLKLFCKYFIRHIENKRIH